LRRFFVETKRRTRRGEYVKSTLELLSLTLHVRTTFAETLKRKNEFARLRRITRPECDDAGQNNNEYYGYYTTWRCNAPIEFDCSANRTAISPRIDRYVFCTTKQNRVRSPRCYAAAIDHENPYSNSFEQKANALFFMKWEKKEKRILQESERISTVALETRNSETVAGGNERVLRKRVFKLARGRNERRRRVQKVFF